MKKSVAVLLFLCFACLLFVACETKTLPTPINLVIEENLLSWDKVENAQEYLVLINEQEYRVSTNYLELSLQDGQNYQIKVKAQGSGGYNDSDFSEILNYSNSPAPSLKRLSPPKIVDIDGLGNLHWTPVPNSSGYRLFRNNVLFLTIDEPNTAEYNLGFTETGTYSIQIQAVGDNVTYSDSAKSNAYKFVIDSDGKPNLPSLTSPIISYNSKTESLEWRSVRNAKEYFVYFNDNIVAVVTASNQSEYSYRINPNFTTNVYSVVAVGDSLAYGLSKKSNIISFPLVPMEPPGNIRIEVVDGTPLIVFDEVEYSRGYVLEINDKQERILTNSFNLNSYSDGEYLVRVSSYGDNLFYTSTAFSEQISVVVENGKIQNPMLSTPDFVRYGNNVLTWNSQDAAEKYEIVVETPYDDALSTLYFTTTEKRLVMDSVLDDVVMIFYVRAYVEGYVTSLYSEGCGYLPSTEKENVDENGDTITVSDNRYYFAKSPTDISYNGEILSWSEVEYAKGYMVKVDGNEYLTDVNSLELTLKGKAVVSVQTLTEKENYYNSPRSKETLICNPQRLTTPLISLDGTILTWESIKNAVEYILYANGEQFRVAGNYLELKNVLKIDGQYSLSLVAVSENTSIYENSLRSEELFFIVDYGEYGTAEKPYLITDYEDFSLLLEYPDACFKIDVKEIDLKNATISPLFEDGFFEGTLDGNGAVIKNFTINATSVSGGFFGALGNAYIHDLGFENVTVLGGVYASVLSHFAIDSVLENVNVRDSVIVLSENTNIAGGMFATFKGKASNIDADIEIILGDNELSGIYLSSIGGFAGSAEGDFENVALSGKIETPTVDDLYAGFFVGDFSGTAQFLNLDDIVLTSGGEFNGIIAGYSQGDYSSVVVNNAILSATFGYNGLFGYFQGNFQGVSTQKITVLSDSSLHVGGFAGYVTNATVDCDIDCDISASGNFVYVGGLVGEVFGNIEFSFNNEINISVKANSGFIGGIFGSSTMNSDCESTGVIEITVNPEKSVTLFVGSFKGEDRDMCSSGNITLLGNILEYLEKESDVLE